MAPIDKLLDALSAAGFVTKKAGAGWRSSCPAHESDSGRSLKIDQDGDGKPLCHCHVCGANLTGVCEALRVEVADILKNGTEMHTRTTAERVRERVRRVIEESRTEYQIRDISGDLIATHTRIDMGPGRKRFVWSTPSCTDGLGGIPGDTLPLYGSEHLMDAPEGVRVFVCEGEKATQSLIDRGYVALGTVCGASSVPNEDALRVLSGCEVVLWPDNDDDGRKHMARIAEAIEDVALVVQIFELPGADAKDDAADYIGDLESDLLMYVRPFRVEREVHADVMRSSSEPPVEWLVENIIARGCVTIMHAPPKEGKSTMLWSMASSVTRGDDAWAGFSLCGKPARTLYVSEEPTGILKAKIIEHGVTPGAPLWILPSQAAYDLQALDAVVEAIGKITRKHEIELLVVDTLAHWSRVYGDSENTAGVMEEAISKFRTLTHTNRAVVLVHHSKKSLEVSDPISALRGSSAIAAACDNVVMVRAPGGKNAEEETTRKIVGRGRHSMHNGAWWVEWDDVAQTFKEVATSPKAVRRAEERENHDRWVIEAMRRLVLRDPTRVAFGRPALAAECETRGHEIPERALKAALARLENDGQIRHNGRGGAAAGFVLTASAAAGRAVADADDPTL